MKNSIKVIILLTLSLLILIGTIFGILSVAEVYTFQEALDNFLKSFYIIFIIAFGLSLISYIISLFKN